MELWPHATRARTTGWNDSLAGEAGSEQIEQGNGKVDRLEDDSGQQRAEEGRNAGTGSLEEDEHV